MKYSIEFKRTAVKDLEKIKQNDALKLMKKIKTMEENLTEDIKKLTNFTPEYRLRLGNYRVLFEIINNKIIIYRIRHRKESYR